MRILRVEYITRWPGSMPEIRIMDIIEDTEASAQVREIRKLNVGGAIFREMPGCGG
jgi:hypothetical protein